MSPGFELDEAMGEVGDVLECFRDTMRWPDLPPFTGGVLDAWPARMVDGLGFAREEWKMVRAHVEREARKAGS